MHLFFFLVFSLFVGLFAKALVSFFFPEKDVMGVIPTTLVGAAGGWLGGFFVSVYDVVLLHERHAHVHPAHFVMSVIGAVGALMLLHQVKK